MGLSASRGRDAPAKTVTEFFPWLGFTCRSSKRPTVFAVAITVRPPARCTISAIVGNEIYFPPDNSSPFSTTAGISTSSDFLLSISGRESWFAIRLLWQSLFHLRLSHSDTRRDDCEKRRPRSPASTAPAYFPG